ncbi:MAG: site-2 protease family protein, partial [Myxococcota bacterium]|nr:site-2 protease family protein [Myxococcota bacterium]
SLGLALALLLPATAWPPAGMLLFANATLAVLNLLPAWPLDGGRVFEGLMRWFGRSGPAAWRATRVATRATAVVVVLWAVAAGNLGGLEFGIVLWVVSCFHDSSESSVAFERPRPVGARVRAGLARIRSSAMWVVLGLLAVSSEAQAQADAGGVSDDVVAASAPEVADTTQPMLADAPPAADEGNERPDGGGPQRSGRRGSGRNRRSPDADAGEHRQEGAGNMEADGSAPTGNPPSAGGVFGRWKDLIVGLAGRAKEAPDGIRTAQPGVVADEEDNTAARPPEFQESGSDLPAEQAAEGGPQASSPPVAVATNEVSHLAALIAGLLAVAGVAGAAWLLAKVLPRLAKRGTRPTEGGKEAGGGGLPASVRQGTSAPAVPTPSRASARQAFAPSADAHDRDPLGHLAILDDPDPLVRAEVLDAEDALRSVDWSPETGGAWASAARTHRGNIRHENQDAAVAFRVGSASIAVIADGLGGVPRGREAARI